MKKRTKKWLITGACLIFVGLIFLTGAIFMGNFDFEKISMIDFYTNEYEISEAYNNISIETKMADIEFITSQNAQTKIVCYEKHKLVHSVSVEDGTLVIENFDTRKWYEYINFNFERPKLTVYIPSGSYGNLNIKGTTGNVILPKEFTFENIDVSVSTGKIKSFAGAAGDVKLKASTGDIFAWGITAGSCEAKVSTGNINISNIETECDVKAYVSTGKTIITYTKCQNIESTGSTGSISLQNVSVAQKLFIERTTGNVELDNSDAKDIYIKTDTGDVKGTLLSEKVFITKTDTGKVSVPYSVTTGGKCEIITDTGDIEIKTR